MNKTNKINMSGKRKNQTKVASPKKLYLSKNWAGVHQSSPLEGGGYIETGSRLQQYKRFQKILENPPAKYFNSH